MFKRSPIIVIRVPERQIDEKYAQVTSAVRALADDFGLRVIVDGSPNFSSSRTSRNNARDGD